jgi:hypothetical protein
VESGYSVDAESPIRSSSIIDESIGNSEFRAVNRLHGSYHSVNTEQGQTTGDDPEIDGQLTISGLSTFQNPARSKSELAIWHEARHISASRFTGAVKHRAIAE